MKKAKKGFTLVELIVAIAILSILATVAVVGYTGYVDKAKNAKAEMELSQIVTYINAELADDGEWGTTTYTVKYNSDKSGFEITGGTNETDIADVIKAYFSDIFTGEQSSKITVNGKTLTYTTSDGGTASMTLN